jgi:hypothetical protein
MSKISSSPERHTFQKEGYIKRQEEQGLEPLEEYIEMFKTWREQDAANLIDPLWQKNNMQYDLRSTAWICDKAKASDGYAQNLYAAICNNDFIKLEVVPILRQDPKRDFWSASWRSAGGIVADMQEKGDYIDWYCSGMGEGLGNGDPDHVKGYVPEGCITDEIRNDLQSLGWAVVAGGDWEKFT